MDHVKKKFSYIHNIYIVSYIYICIYIYSYHEYYFFNIHYLITHRDTACIVVTGILVFTAELG